MSYRVTCPYKIRGQYNADGVAIASKLFNEIQAAECEDDMEKCRDILNTVDRETQVAFKVYLVDDATGEMVI